MTGISVEMQGLSQLMAQLQRIEDIGDQVVLDVLNNIAEDTQSFAIDGISRGPKTGRVYEFEYFTDGQGRLRQGVARSKPHQASAPGEYPASDKGRLGPSVRVELPSLSKLVARVGTAVAYGPMLEFGTSKMAARPWLLPSFEKAKIGAARELKKRLEARI